MAGLEMEHSDAELVVDRWKFSLASGPCLKSSAPRFLCDAFTADSVESLSERQLELPQPSFGLPEQF
eukprot:2433005-Amphidinium_carterae.1